MNFFDTLSLLLKHWTIQSSKSTWRVNFVFQSCCIFTFFNFLVPTQFMEMRTWKIFIFFSEIFDYWLNLQEFEKNAILIFRKFSLIMNRQITENRTIFYLRFSYFWYVEKKRLLFSPFSFHSHWRPYQWFSSIPSRFKKTHEDVRMT